MPLDSLFSVRVTSLRKQATTQMGRCTGIEASGRWVAPEGETAGVETVALDDTAGEGGVSTWRWKSQGEV